MSNVITGELLSPISSKRVNKEKLFKLYGVVAIIFAISMLAFLLITICYKHADYLYNSETIPALFSTFNKMAAIMILGQSFVWYKQVNKIVLGESSRSNPALVPGFILAAILTPPDPITQIGLALPLLILYELSILAVKIIEKKRNA